MTNVPKPRSKMRTLQWAKIPATNVLGKDNLWSYVGKMDGKFTVDYNKMDELFSVSHQAGKRPGSDAGQGSEGVKRKENLEVGTSRSDLVRVVRFGHKAQSG